MPEGCLFDHIHNASRCWPFVRWNQTGAAACQERNMQMRSFAMLLPCGISLFSGVEFVCCPKHFKGECQIYRVWRRGIDVEFSLHSLTFFNLFFYQIVMKIFSRIASDSKSISLHSLEWENLPHKLGNCYSLSLAMDGVKLKWNLWLFLCGNFLYNNLLQFHHFDTQLRLFGVTINI